MKISVTIISFILLVVFFGLLGVGIIVSSHINAQSHPQAANCFGNSCGPVQHVVAHDYVILSWPQARMNRSQERYLAGQLIILNNAYRIPDTPPPKFPLS